VEREDFASFHRLAHGDAVTESEKRKGESGRGQRGQHGAQGERLGEAGRDGGEGADQLAEDEGGVDVEAGGGLIEDEQVRVVEEGGGDEDFLSHPL
jgi:hypothetical protein